MNTIMKEWCYAVADMGNLQQAYSQFTSQYVMRKSLNFPVYSTPDALSHSEELLIPFPD